MRDVLSQEQMQVVVVDDFSALQNPECRADLRRSPFPGLGDAAGNGIRAVAPGKRITLRRRNAALLVLRKICCFFSGRTFRDPGLTAAGNACAQDFSPALGKEGQKNRKYEHKLFQGVQR